MKKIIILICVPLFLMMGCDDEVEINLGNGIENPASFRVDFDGETFVADIATANIYNGVTVITAKKHETNELIVLTLNDDQVGEYNFIVGQNIGENSYQLLNEDPFVNLKTVTSGRIDITKIDDESKLLDGTFSFIGTRFIQQFDDLGNPILDTNNKLVFNTETKIFTNGTFKNIIFTREDMTTLPVNEFYANKDITNNNLSDGSEYVEDKIVARKETFGTTAYITITAQKEGFESIMFRIPSVATAGDNLQIDDVIILGTETIANYTVDEETYFLAVNQDEDMLHITSHNLVSRKIEGTFNFDGVNPNTGDWIQFVDGSFSVIYTEN